MNIDRNVDAEWTKTALERSLSGALERIVSEVAWLRGWRIERGPDASQARCLHEAGGAARVFRVFFKGPDFRPRQLTSIDDRAGDAVRESGEVPVLAMPRLSPRLVGLCEQSGWSWFDLAGNCRLEIPGVLLIERSGREPVKAKRRTGSNFTSPESARVVRALLAPENAGRRWTQRELATHFAAVEPVVPSPSLALVNKLVQHLRDEALIELLPNRGFRVLDHGALLAAWRDAYRFERHVRRPCFTLLQGKLLHETLRRFGAETTGGLAYAAYSAADFQAPSVRQPLTWLYVRSDVEADLVATLEAKDVDSGANLILLIPDDLGVFYGIDTAADRAACTNPVQTYIDLMHAGGRGEDAAGAILELRLAPEWGARKPL